MRGTTSLQCPIGLMLQQLPEVTSFQARIFRNDFLGSTTRAIGVLGTYTLSTELSLFGVGNYWGNSTPPCFNEADTPTLLIKDSNAFCIPVAVTSSEAR